MCRIRFTYIPNYATWFSLCRVRNSHCFGYEAYKQQESRVLLATCFMLASCLVYFSTLKMERHILPEHQLFQQTTRRYIPDDATLHLSLTPPSSARYIQDRPTYRAIDLLINKIQLLSNIPYFILLKAEKGFRFQVIY
jgi:hypothetical protein